MHLLIINNIIKKETYFGKMPESFCISEAMINHMEFFKLKLFSNFSGSTLHGCGLFHSSGAILQKELHQVCKTIIFENSFRLIY